MLIAYFKVLKELFRKHLHSIIYPLHFTQVNDYATLLKRNSKCRYTAMYLDIRTLNTRAY